MKNNKNPQSLDRWENIYVNYPEIYDMYAIYQDKDKKALKSLLKHINLKGKSVLEIGVGTGMYTKDLAEISKKYTAIDVSEGLLKIAEQKYNNKKKITYLKADCTDIPLKENSFDIIFSSWGFPPYKNTNKAFKEMYRVGKPNSEIWIITNYPKGEMMDSRGQSEINIKQSRLDNFIKKKFQIVEVVKSKYDFPDNSYAKNILTFYFGPQLQTYLNKHPNPKNMKRSIAILYKKNDKLIKDY